MKTNIVITVIDGGRAITKQVIYDVINSESETELIQKAEQDFIDLIESCVSGLSDDDRDDILMDGEFDSGEFQFYFAWVEVIG